MIVPNLPGDSSCKLLSTCLETPDVARECLAHLSTPDLRGLLSASREYETLCAEYGTWDIRYNSFLDNLASACRIGHRKPLTMQSSSFGNQYHYRKLLRCVINRDRAWLCANLRQNRRFEGHTDCVTSIALQPQNCSFLGHEELSGYRRVRMASGSHDGLVLVWQWDRRILGNEETASEQNELEVSAPCGVGISNHPSATVSVVAWPSYSSLLSASYDGRLRLFDASFVTENGSSPPLACWASHSDRILALAHDGPWNDVENLGCRRPGLTAMTGGRDARLYIFDFRDGGKHVAEFAGSDAICYYSLAYAGADIFFAGNHRGRIEQWDIRYLREPILEVFDDTFRDGTLNAQPSPGSVGGIGSRPVTTLATKGNCLAAGDKDGNIRLFNFTKDHFVDRENGSFDVTTSASGVQFLGGLAGGHEIPPDPSRSPTHPDNFKSRGVRSIAFLSRGRALVSSSNDGTVRLWDISPVTDNDDASALSTTTSTLLPQTDAKRRPGAQVPMVIADEEEGYLYVASADGFISEHQTN